jgi:hypothetical protein
MNQTVRTFLTEALGVPENILESAEKLYKNIKIYIDNLDDPIEDTYTFNKKISLRISEMMINEVEVELGFTETTQVDEVRYYSMSYSHKSKFDDRKLKIVDKPFAGKINLNIDFAYPPGSTMDDVKNYFNKESIDITSSLAHELKHSFDATKTPGRTVKSMSSYLGVQRTNFPFKPISDFLFNLYFIHGIENLVRPTEIASLLKSNNVKKRDFYNFLLDSNLYNKLKMVNNFTYSNMVNELKDDSENVKDFLEHIGVDVDSDDPDYLVNKLLRVLYVNIVNNTTSSAKSLMSNNMFEELMGFIGQKDVLYSRIFKEALKFQGREEDYYKYQEKYFKYISDKMIRKISKLYAMTSDDLTSIKDWELHQKISGKTNEEIDIDYKF